MMSDWARRVERSVVGYPLTGVYLAGTAVAVLISADLLPLAPGLLGLLVVAGLMLMVGIRREVATVHWLVNSQRDVLLDRIDQLIATLTDAGVVVPDEENR